MMKSKNLIPIGIDCTAAHFLSSERLRKEAYPFDWNVTPLSSAIELIENDFQGFLELDNLEFLPPTKRLLFEENGIDLKISNDIITPVICKRYGILYPHDFSQTGEDDFRAVKQKYERRIERLRKCISEMNNFTFVYNIGNLNEWQIEQYNLIGLKFRSVSDYGFSELKNKMQNLSYSFISLRDLKEHQII